MEKSDEHKLNRNLDTPGSDAKREKMQAEHNAEAKIELLNKEAKKRATEAHLKALQEQEAKERVNSSNSTNAKTSGFTGELVDKRDGKAHFKVNNGDIHDDQGKLIGHLNPDGSVLSPDRKASPTLVNSRFDGFSFRGTENGQDRQFICSDSAQMANGRISIPMHGKAHDCEVRMGMVIDKTSGKQLGILEPPKVVGEHMSGGSITFVDRNPPEKIDLAKFRDSVFELTVLDHKGASATTKISGACLGGETRDLSGKVISGGLLNIQASIDVAQQSFAQAQQRESDNTGMHYSLDWISGAQGDLAKAARTDQKTAQMTVDVFQKILKTGTVNDAELKQVRALTSNAQVENLGGEDSVAGQHFILDHATSQMEHLPPNTKTIQGEVVIVDKNAHGGHRTLSIHNGVIFGDDGKHPIASINSADGTMTFLDPHSGRKIAGQMASLTGAVWRLKWVENKAEKETSLVSLGERNGLVSLNELRRQADAETASARKTYAFSNSDDAKQLVEDTENAKIQFNKRLNRILAKGTEGADVAYLAHGSSNVRMDAGDDSENDAPLTKAQHTKIAIPSLKTPQVVETVNGRVRIDDHVYNIVEGKLYDAEASNKKTAPVGQLEVNYGVSFVGGEKINLADHHRVLMEFTAGNSSEKHQLIGLGPAHNTDSFGTTSGGLIDVKELTAQIDDARASAKAGRDDYLKTRPWCTGAFADHAMGDRQQVLNDFAGTMDSDAQKLHLLSADVFSHGFSTAHYSNNKLDDSTNLAQLIVNNVGAEGNDSVSLAQEGKQVQKMTNDSFVIAAETVATLGIGEGFTIAANAGKVTKFMQIAGSVTTGTLASSLISVGGRASDSSSTKDNFASGLVEGLTMSAGGAASKAFGDISQIPKIQKLVGALRSGSVSVEELAPADQELLKTGIGKLIQSGRSANYCRTLTTTYQVEDSYLQATGFGVAGNIREHHALYDPKAIATGTAAMFLSRGVGQFAGKATEGLVSASTPESSVLDELGSSLQMGTSQTTESFVRTNFKDGLASRMVSDSSSAYANGFVGGSADAFEHERQRLAKQRGVSVDLITDEYLMSHADFSNIVGDMNESGMMAAGSSPLMSLGVHSVTNAFARATEAPASQTKSGQQADSRLNQTETTETETEPGADHTGDLVSTHKPPNKVPGERLLTGRQQSMGEPQVGLEIQKDDLVSLLNNEMTQHQAGDNLRHGFQAAVHSLEQEPSPLLTPAVRARIAARLRTSANEFDGTGQHETAAGFQEAAYLIDGDRRITSTSGSLGPIRFSLDALHAQMSAQGLSQAEIIASVRPENKIGRGGNATVYKIDGLPDFVLRVPGVRGNAPKLEGGLIEAIPDILPEANIGQPVAKLGNATILKMQQGIPSGGPLRTDARLMGPEAARRVYDESVERAANMPQAAYDQLAETLLLLGRNGLNFDPSKANNILIDVPNQRFNVVDISKRSADSKYHHSLTDMVITLMDNGFVNGLPDSGATNIENYQLIISKATLAAQKTGLPCEENSSLQFSFDLAKTKSPEFEPQSSSILTPASESVALAKGDTFEPSALESQKILDGIRQKESIAASQQMFNRARESGQVLEVKKQLYNVRFEKVTEPDGRDVQTIESRLGDHKPEHAKQGDFVAVRLSADGKPDIEDGAVNQWPVTEKTLRKTYNVKPEDLEKTTFIAPTKADGPTVHMVRLDKDTTIQTAWGAVSGKKGAWLVNYDFDGNVGTPGEDFNILSARSFHDTYEPATENSVNLLKSLTPADSDSTHATKTAIRSALTSRTVDDYLSMLQIPDAELGSGRVVVDVGAGAQQEFARGAAALGKQATVLSIDPGLGANLTTDLVRMPGVSRFGAEQTEKIIAGIDLRKNDPAFVPELKSRLLAVGLPPAEVDAIAGRVRGRFDSQAGSMAALGDALPLAANSVDSLYSNYAVSLYVTDPAQVKATLSEFVRALKPGGTARIYPIGDDDFAVWKQALDSRGIKYDDIQDPPESGVGIYVDGRDLPGHHLLVIHKDVPALARLDDTVGTVRTEHSPNTPITEEFPDYSPTQLDRVRPETVADLNKWRTLEGSNVGEKFDALTKNLGLSEAETNQILDGLAVVREHGARMKESDPEQEINWKHTQREFGTAVDYAMRNGFSKTETQNLLLAAMFSDGLKTKFNFTTHNSDGATAFAEFAKTHLQDMPADQIAGIKQTILEHQVAPPQFMAMIYGGAITGAITKGEQRSLTENETAALTSLKEKIANPFALKESDLEDVPGGPPGSKRIALTPEEQALLRRTGLESWYVPSQKNSWNKVSRGLIDSDGIDNYAGPGGLSKIVGLRGPGKIPIFQDRHVLYGNPENPGEISSVGSWKQSLGDFLGDPSKGRIGVATEQTRTYLQQQSGHVQSDIDAARNRVTEWINSPEGRKELALSPQEKIESVPGWTGTKEHPDLINYDTASADEIARARKIWDRFADELVRQQRVDLLATPPYEPSIIADATGGFELTNTQLIKAETSSVPFTWTDLKGEQRHAAAGDWRITRADGYVYSEKPEIFRATHVETAGKPGLFAIKPGTRAYQLLDNTAISSTLSGFQTARQGDWLIVGPQGEKQLLSSEQFAERYNAKTLNPKTPIGYYLKSLPIQATPIKAGTPFLNPDAAKGAKPEIAKEGDMIAQPIGQAPYMIPGEYFQEHYVELPAGEWARKDLTVAQKLDRHETVWSAGAGLTEGDQGDYLVTRKDGSQDIVPRVKFDEQLAFYSDAPTQVDIADSASTDRFIPQVLRAEAREVDLGGQKGLTKPIDIAVSQALDESGRFPLGFNANLKTGELHFTFAHLVFDDIAKAVKAPVSEIQAGIEVRVNGQPVASHLRESQGLGDPEFMEWTAPNHEGASTIELSFYGHRIGLYSYNPDKHVMMKLDSSKSLSAFDIRQFHAKRGYGEEWKQSGATINSTDIPANQIDLHTHFAGAMRAETILEVGRKAETPYPTELLDEFKIKYNHAAVREVDGKPTVTLAPENFPFTDGLEKLEAMLSIPEDRKISFQDMENIYKLRSPLVKDRNAFPLYLEQIAKDYHNQGVRYAELSLSDVLKPEWLDAARQALPEIERQTGVKLRFIVGMWRHSEHSYNDELVRKVIALGREPLVVGVDFMGEETNQTLSFAPELRALAEYRKTRPEFQIRVHAGENPLNLANIKEAIRLGATRIGHGIYGVDAETLNLAKQHDVIIEFNTNSNLALSNIDGNQQLPVKEYLDAGVRISLGTDGHGLYGTSARSEEAVMRSLGLTRDDLAKITESDQRYTDRMTALSTEANSNKQANDAKDEEIEPW